MALFRLRVRTSRVELSIPRDEDLVELAQLAARGIHPRDLMPFTVPWTDRPSPALESSLLQWNWRARAEFSRDRWALEMAVRADGKLVGIQALYGNNFPVLRTVATGSWLGREYQGKGLGTEMRAAALYLSFAGLSAEVARSDAFSDNPASGRVSEKLGYVHDGVDRVAPRGTVVETNRFRLTREAWEAKRFVQVQISDLAPCLELFGLG